MATIMIYEPNEIIAQKLCDSLKKEKYNAIRCDENVIPSFSDDSIPLVMMDAQLRWTTCRPLLEAFQKHGCPILFLTGDRKMSAHLRALYGGRSDVLTVPFSQKALHAKVHNALGECAPLRELSVDEKERVALLDGRRADGAGVCAAAGADGKAGYSRKPGAAFAPGLGLPEHGRNAHGGRACTASAQEAGRRVYRNCLQMRLPAQAGLTARNSMTGAARPVGVSRRSLSVKTLWEALEGCDPPKLPKGFSQLFRGRFL